MKVKLNFERNIMAIKFHHGMRKNWPSHIKLKCVMNFLLNLAPQDLNSIFQKLDSNIMTIVNP